MVRPQLSRFCEGHLKQRVPHQLLLLFIYNFRCRFRRIEQRHLIIGNYYCNLEWIKPTIRRSFVCQRYENMLYLEHRHVSWEGGNETPKEFLLQNHGHSPYHRVSFIMHDIHSAYDTVVHRDSAEFKKVFFNVAITRLGLEIYTQHLSRST